MAGTSSFVKISMICFTVEFMLKHKFPHGEFKVSVSQNIVTLTSNMQVRVTKENGEVVYLPPFVAFHDSHWGAEDKPLENWKFPDEQMATIMLILG